MDYKDSKWHSADVAKNYNVSSDMLVMRRREMYDMSLELFEFIFAEASKSRTLKVLDVGGGEGELLSYFVNSKLKPHCTLLDGSTPMLDAAKKRFEGCDDSVSYVQTTFEDALAGKVEVESGFDLVISSMVMHHMETEQRRKMVEFVYHLLAKGGMFLIMEQANVADEQYTAFYDMKHVRYMKDMLANVADENLKKHMDPEKRKHHLKHSVFHTLYPLSSQLKDLEDAGFSACECFFKYLTVVLVGGRK